MFDAIPGQARAKAFFSEVLQHGPGHAYLLAGGDGLGQRAFALDLARAMVTACGGCGVCDECARAERGVHPDLTVVERDGEFIKTAQIGALIADLSLKPFVAGRRVWIILEAERLNEAAANKFLKSLEEPPPHVHFILVSSALERMLSTIVSRCQVIDFQPVADDEIGRFLVERGGVAAGDAAALARLARGSVDRALRLADDARGPQRRARFLRLAAGVAVHDLDAERAFIEEVAAAEKAAADKALADIDRRRAELERVVTDDKDLKWHTKLLDGLAKREQARVMRLACLDAVDHLAGWLRDEWVLGLGATDAVWNQDQLDALTHSGAAKPELCERLVAVTGRTRKDIYLNVDRRLALQAMFARFQEVWESA